MDYNLLIDKISGHFKNGLPFVIFSLPNQTTISAMLQQNAKAYSLDGLNNNGFIFAPFNYTEPSFFIPESDSEVFRCGFKGNPVELKPVSVPRTNDEEQDYIKLCTKAIEAIKRRNAIKIVISRKSDFRLRDFSIQLLAEGLFSAYPTAFRYIWYHPNTGLWCGATPETLVQIENSSFKTMALAGTQPLSGRSPIFWGAKELEEQQLVTDAIIDNLQRVTSVLKVSNPYTHQAGSLMHLRTDITGILKSGKATLSTVAAAMHPTPAVGGSPKKFAKKFILENEGYNREFYTGFLGPILENGRQATLMVNLRCMKIDNDMAHIFVGGGITLSSKPKDEWVETQNKMQTMLQVLQPLL